MFHFIVVGVMLTVPSLGSLAEQPTLRCPVISGRMTDLPRPSTEQIEWLLNSSAETDVQLLLSFSVQVSNTRSQNERIPMLGPCDVVNASCLTIAVGHSDGIPLFRVVQTRQLQYQMVGASLCKPK